MVEVGNKDNWVLNAVYTADNSYNLVLTEYNDGKKDIIREEVITARIDKSDIKAMLSPEGWVEELWPKDGNAKEVMESLDYMSWVLRGYIALDLVQPDDYSMSTDGGSSFYEINCKIG